MCSVDKVEKNLLKNIPLMKHLCEHLSEQKYIF